MSSKLFLHTVKFRGGTDAISATDQGASVVVTGGVSISESLWAGTSINASGIFQDGKQVANQIDIPIAGTGLIKTDSTFSVDYSSITTVGTLTGLTSSGIVSILDTTAATAVNTGALRVSGGIYSGGNVYVGENVDASSAPTVGSHLTNKTYVDGLSYLTAGTGLTLSGSTLSVNATQTGITSLGTLTGLTSSGVVSINNTTDSLTIGGGSLKVSGGMYVYKRFVIGVGSTYNTTNTTGFYQCIGGTANDTATAASTTVAGASSCSFQTPTISATNTGVTYTNAYNVYIGGAPTAGTNMTITNPYALYVNSGTSYFGGTLTSSGVVNITNVTNSTSIGTGALTVSGGISSGGNVYVSGNVNASTAPTVGAHLANKTYIDGLTYLTAGTGLTKAGSTISVNAAQTGIISLGTLTGLTSSGIVSVTSTIDSTSTTTGAVQISGGVGIKGSASVGGSVSISDITTYAEDGNIYPPASLTSSSTNLSGFQNMANGTYVVSASSINSTNNAYKAFNRSSNGSIYWESARNVYTVGNYTGTVTTTDVAGNVYAGEWIQIAFPNPIKVGSIIVDPINLQSMLFKNYALLGSNDGNTWNSVTSGTITFTQYTINVLTFINNTAFMYYRLVVMSNAGGSSSTVLFLLSFKESSILRLGNEYDRVDVGNIPLYSKTVFSISPYPPVTLSHNTANLQGYSWGNGMYVVNESSAVLSWFRGLYAFSKENVNWWQSNVTYNNGPYAGGVSTTVDGNAVLGEWVQIKLPDAILLQSFSVIPYDLTTAFTGYVLAGSLDGTKWTSIASGTAVWSTVQSQTFTSVASTYMSYYRLIITSIISSTNARIVNLTLNGSGPMQSLQIDGNVIISSTSDTTGSNSGALQVQGGLGISKSLFTGGNVLPAIDNTSAIGSTSNRWTAVYAVNGTIQTSDENLKSDIKPLEIGLDFVKKLKPIAYKMPRPRTREDKEEETFKLDKATEKLYTAHHMGVSAQQVREAIKYTGLKDFAGVVQAEDGTYMMNYSQLIAPLIKAIQELTEMREKDRESIKYLKKRLEENG